MYFGFVGSCVTHDVSAHFIRVWRVSDYLKIELSAKDYGPGVTRFLMGVNCCGVVPGYPPQLWHDFETGTVVGKKYTKSSKLLEVEFKLNHGEVMSSDPDSDCFIEILKRGVLATYAEVKALGINGFDVDAFYRDIGILIDERGWIKNPEKYRKAPSEYTEHLREGVTQSVPRELVMPEVDFWGLIQQSIEASNGDVDRQLAYLEDRLATKREEEIVGFELALRDLLRRSYHHNVVALLKVVEGMVTDDSLLYFRCRLILYGRDVFYTAIEDPNKLTRRLDDDPAAELLLTVADEAFLKKFGKNTDKDLPRDIGSSYIDYNTDAYPMRGRPWTDRTFAKRYAALLRLYRS